MTSQLHQLLKRALLNNTPILEHHNTVCILDSAQSVRDWERSFVFEDFLQILKDVFFGVSIESRCELIEEEDFGFFDKAPTESYSLFLSPWNLPSLLSYFFVEPYIDTDIPSSQSLMKPLAWAILVAF